MSGSLVLLIGIWLLSLLLVARMLARFSIRTAMRGWPDPLGGVLLAETRARALLREMLTEAEYEQLTQQGYLEVRSPNKAHRTYRIPASTGRVRVFDRGRETVELCVQPTESLPNSDVVLLHKLMIEANEEEYLARANHFAPGTLALTLRRV
jgi:hypothetical protein